MLRSKLERKEDLYRIVRMFGNKAQLLKFSEESGELIKACVKYEDGISMTKDNILEEIADVQVMVDQIITMYDIDPRDIKKVYDSKIDRVMHRYF